MVDEFQDTNRLQCELIDLVAREDGELFFVGDEFQSIYRFRHADVEVFRERRAQSGGVLALTQNYRSRPEVLAVVNHLFAAEFGDEFQPLDAAGRFPDPAFGPAVELLVTDKDSYKGPARTGARPRPPRRRAACASSSIRARRPRARSCCSSPPARTRELYEEALRAAGPPDLPRDRPRLLRPAAGGRPARLPAAAAQPLRRRGARDGARLSARRRLERRARAPAAGRAEAAALRRARAGRADGLSPRDAQLFEAFRQRYDRLAAQASSLGLERLCERIVTEHDYDLAVLARWDGRRRYANLRKLARLARSYEELRGPDVEGFVRFVADQDAAGASELEAVAEEEGADVIRLLTIHAAKGLEFKVVVVSDAGRDRARPDADEILVPAGRPASASACRPRQRPALSRRSTTRTVKDGRARRRGGRAAAPLLRGDDARDRPADRLRRDRRGRGGRGNADRLGARPARARELDDAGTEPLEIERGGARLLLRVDRSRRSRRRPWSQTCRSRTSSSSCSQSGERRRGGRGADACAARRGASATAPPRAPALLQGARAVRALLLPLLRRAGGRPTARRAAPARGREGLPRPRSATPFTCCWKRSTCGLRRCRRSSTSSSAARYPDATAEELERIRAFVAGYCDSELAATIAALEGAAAERPFAFEHDGVLLHGRLDVLHRDGKRSLVVDYKTNSLAEGTPAEIVEHDYQLQRLVYALACFRGGADEVEVVYQFLERPDELVTRSYKVGRRRRSRRSCRRRSRGSRQATSGRRRTSSSAATARRSTSSARARGSAAPDGAELRRRGQAAGRAEARADRADHRAAPRPSIRTRGSPCVPATTWSCSSR